MRKMTAVLAAAVMLLCCAVPAWAEGEPAGDKSVKDAYALLELWTREATANADQNDQFRMMYAQNFPYPDYINGVWSTDGTVENLTFAYLPGHKAEAEAELACVEDQSTVTLVEGGKYTIDELIEVDTALRAYLGGDSGIFGFGIGLMSNSVECDINMEAEGAAGTRSELEAKFGDRISFREGEGVFAEAAVATADTSGELVSENVPAGTEPDQIEDEENFSSDDPMPRVTGSIIMLAAVFVAIIAVVFFAVRKGKNQTEQNDRND